VTVTVSTSATFSMISILPGIPQTRTFTRSATMRVPEF
jgi:hypothetical protein